MDHDRTLAALAARQHTVFSRVQAAIAGVPPYVVDRRLRQGRLVRLHVGVYGMAGVPPTFLRDVMAACLAAGPDAAASHRAAGALWNLRDVGPRVDVSVAGCQPTVRRARVHRVTALAPEDVCRRAGIPVTTPARTLVDLAGAVPAGVLEVALDDALARRLVTCAHVRVCLDRLGRRGRKGAGRLAALLDARPDGRFRVQSEFERRLLTLLDDANVPGAVPQYEVVLPSGRRVRIDVAFPPGRLAVEADSYVHHGTRTAWSADHARNAELVAAGWRVLAITWDDLERRPHRVVRLIRDALAGDVCEFRGA